MCIRDRSCTGGLLASKITSISGASKIFNLGLVTYSNQAKNKILKVNGNIIKKSENTKVLKFRGSVATLDLDTPEDWETWRNGRAN